MKEIIEKLIEEEKELTVKIHNLEIFLHKQREQQTISDTQFNLLSDQIYYMREYAEILRIRIAILKEEYKRKEISISTDNWSPQSSISISISNQVRGLADMTE